MSDLDKLVGITGQYNELVKRVAGGSLDPDPVRRALQCIIEGRFSGYALNGHEWYMPPAEQLQYVRRLAREREWNVSIPKDVPAYIPRSKWEVLVLAVYLPAAHGRSGPQRTLEELWLNLSAPLGFVKDVYDETEWTCVEPAGDAPYTPGARWMWVDVNRHQVLSPADALREEKVDHLAGLEVLMLALLCPEWIRTWGTIGSPIPYMAGLWMYKNAQQEGVPHVPRLGIDPRRHILRLAVDRCDTAFAYCGSPTVREG